MFKKSLLLLFRSFSFPAWADDDARRAMRLSTLVLTPLPIEG
jgi:hypothetical protein